MTLKNVIINKPLIQLSSERQAMPKLLRIGDLAEKTGKSKRALRLYEELGLLVPSERSSGGFRLYHEGNAERVFWISKLQDLGFTLPEIGELLNKSRAPGLPKEIMGDIKAEFQKRLDDLESQLERFEHLREELKDSLNHLSGCTSCEQLEENVLPAEICCSCCGRSEAVPPLLNNLWQGTGN